MSVITKDLGAATAYGYAVEKGYTGTEEEFAELMASYATVGQTAVDAKDAAVAAKTAAQTAATTATNKASEATTAATTATTKAGDAQTSAQTASSKASEAGTSASTASAKASESAQSASQALTYKTDAESAKTSAQTAQGLAESARDLAQSYAEDAQGYAEDAQASAESISASASQIAQNTADIAAIEADASDIEELFKTTENVDFSTAHYKRGLVNSSNKWSISTGFYSYYFAIESGQYNSVTVTASANYSANISFLASDSLPSQATPTWASGYTGRQIVAAGETQTFAIPSDCIYIVVQKEASASDYTPADMAFESYKSIPDRDETLTISGDYPDSKVVGDKIASINDYLFGNEPIDVSRSSYRVYIPSSTGLWKANFDYSSAIVPIDQRFKKIVVTANSNNNANVALLTTSNHVDNSSPDYATGCDRLSIPAGVTQEINVPDDAKYLYCLKTTSSSTNTPASITGVYLKSADATPLGLHEFPPTESALNIVKRCRQMTDIKWTPAVDLSRYILAQTSNPPATAEAQRYKGTFKAGTEYKGIPYGRTSQTMTAYGYDYATIGSYIDFGTFVSSVSNPKSKLSLADIGAVAGHTSVIYASVCSGLACYALGVNEVATANIPSISGLSLVGKVNNNGTLLSDTLFKIGDVLNLQGSHVGIITDIIRDGNGLIQLIEISECTPSGLADKNYLDGLIGGVARRKGWTRWNLFYERWKDYSLYRYSGTVTYTPSQYVNVGDEFDGYVVEHFPIMPYEGEGFAYKTGYIPSNAVKLVYTLSDYAYVKVFKDGTEISGSPFALTEGADSIDISTITTGEYSAYLCNITDGDVVNCTYPCHWSIT